MSTNNTLIRSLHDLGLAAWFGGYLMGAVGLNGAAASARDRTERLTISSKGWARWVPVQLAALIAHGIGGVGLIAANRGRLAVQQQGRANTAVKLGLTAAALGASGWSAVLGAKIAKSSVVDREGGEGATEPDAGTSADLAAVQKQQRILQWVTPVITAALIVLAAQQGEQQRVGVLRKLLS
ncbi:MAG: hypothetical protein HY996_04840 [Micrococcales bacterium]|nr:hypothetical protein [Micrococcales bacterium]